MARLYVKLGDYFLVEVNGEADEVVKIVQDAGVTDAMRRWVEPSSLEDDTDVIANETNEIEGGLRIDMYRCLDCGLERVYEFVGRDYPERCVECNGALEDII